MFSSRLSAPVFAFFLCLYSVSAQDLPSLLSDFVSSNDRTQRELILLKISEHHPEAGPALLKIASETKDTETKWLAIRGIGDLKYKEAAPFLRGSLRSSSNYVRANSARALREIHDSDAIPDLIQTLSKDEDNGVLEQTCMALQWLGAKAAIPELKARSNSSSAQTRLWMIGAIESLGSRDVPFFASFLYDSDQHVAAYAAHAIERVTKENFGFPECGKNGGFCSYGYGVENAQRWWNSHKADWKQ
jgi:HEAT repeat protein